MIADNSLRDSDFAVLEKLFEHSRLDDELREEVIRSHEYLRTHGGAMGPAYRDRARAIAAYLRLVDSGLPVGPCDRPHFEAPAIATPPAWMTNRSLLPKTPPPFPKEFA